MCWGFITSHGCVSFGGGVVVTIQGFYFFNLVFFFLLLLLFFRSCMHAWISTFVKTFVCNMSTSKWFFDVCRYRSHCCDVGRVG